ncbi:MULTISPECIES: AAA family ATPase [Dietzia]|uniref:AAA family ATPase n=1 Tax=Dietzia TaxID=37914 RepID=UPI0013D61F79|nr:MULTISPECIES: AAA family ATPase [Dietzia]MCT1435254.1 ATP-binding protein [Dietzia maris]MCT1522435.1 ATP-binding protein [Dietzia maris]
MNVLRSGTLLWINGAHGSGKTHVAADLVRRVPHSHLADPEHVGFGLRRMYPRTVRPDYRTLDAWTSAVPSTLIDILDRTGATIIAPQTVADSLLLSHVLDPVRESQHRVVHVTLSLQLHELRRRLRSRGDVIASYAQHHADATLDALSAPEFGVHIDTGNRTVQQVADEIAKVAGLDIRPDRSFPAARAIRTAALRVSAIRSPWA